MSRITIACLQLEALGLSRAEEALDRALALLDAAGKNGPDLMVLPECTYPAYYLESVESISRARLRPHEEVVRLFGERARAQHSFVVAGIAQPGKSPRLLNTAYLFDPQGEVIGRYSKSFLWHFDQCWFDPGRQFPTFDLPFGRTGIFVCADGRMPEIARLLGVRGAKLMVDATAWVTSGGDRATLSNPQFEYMIPVRAVENGAWVAVAGKVGVEAESIVYCGRSCVVSPQGECVVQASTTQEEYVLAEVDLAHSTGPPVPRRPECYAILGEPVETLPVTRLLSEPIVPARASMRLGMLQLKPYPSPTAYWERVTALSEKLACQGTALILLPGIPAAHADAAAYQAEYSLKPLQDLALRLGCGLACPLISKGSNGRRRRTVYLLSKGDLMGAYHQVHLAGERWEAGDTLPVFDTPYGRIGIMQDDEGLLPEVARVLMLQGADLILWNASSSRYPLRIIARARADENKVFIALATPLEENTPTQSALVNPAGAFLATALPDLEQAIAGQVAWALARYKEMAPNTNVVLNRQPAVYGKPLT
ncbi:MAG: carbon-nitrogen hydrolase family protein [Acidobacteria bacterium]|nr:carbon-nitrogen hydrolase family protein [Acidobacteriota bacterium]